MPQQSRREWFREVAAALSAPLAGWPRWKRWIPAGGFLLLLAISVFATCQTVLMDLDPSRDARELALRDARALLNDNLKQVAADAAPCRVIDTSPYPGAIPRTVAGAFRFTVTSVHQVGPDLAVVVRVVAPDGDLFATIEMDTRQEGGRWVLEDFGVPGHGVHDTCGRDW